MRDLEESLEAYERLFGLRPTHTEVRDDLYVRIAFLPIGEATIELLQPTVPGRGRIGEFIDTRGEGIHHIAYRVERDLEHILADMKDAGVALRDQVPRLGAKGSRIAFISPEENNNVLTELVEHREEE